MTYLYELDDLYNIIDDIIPDQTFTEDILEFIETLLYLMDDYINENPQAIIEEDFEECFKEDLLELLYITIEYCEEIDEIEEIIDFTFDIFFETIYNARSESLNVHTNSKKLEIKTHIEELRLKPQPVQRTADWYQFRYNLITASSAHKMFESQSCLNQLIYEKCQPLKVEEKTIVNVNTTLHWGQKYEPLSVIIYENMNNTTIEDFGCIAHDTHRFLGASPDGINVDENSPLFGRMLEIKNIVNREITGIPLREYWIQMQLQMEVWDLDECDFLETKFVEYETESDFYQGQDSDKLHGVIMYFNTKDSKPYYLYKPLHITNRDDIVNWEEENIDSHDNMMWIKNIYWKLEKMSCVLVLRNKKWFEDNVTQMENVWKIIEKERMEGYEHRAPKRKAKVEKSYTGLPTGCFLHIKSTEYETAL